MEDGYHEEKKVAPPAKIPYSYDPGKVTPFY